MQFKMEGIKDIQKALKKNATLEDVKKVVKVNTAELTKNAQKDAPVDTGALRRSITMKTSNGGLTGEVVPAVNYAPYVEYGTRFQQAQPYIRPNFNVQKEKFKNAMGRLMK